MIKVYETQISRVCGPIVYTDVQGPVSELEDMLAELEIGDIFTITVAEMEQAEFDALEEFAGY